MPLARTRMADMLVPQLGQGVYAGLRMRPTNYDMYEIDFDAPPARVMPEPESETEVPEGENDATAR